MMRCGRLQKNARYADVEDVDDAKPCFRFRICEALFHCDKGCGVLGLDRRSQWLPGVAIET